MCEKQSEAVISRRALLEAAAAGMVTLSATTGEAAESASPGKKSATVRDRLWLFTVFAGGDNDSLESGE